MSLLDELKQKRKQTLDKWKHKQEAAYSCQREADDAQALLVEIDRAIAALEPPLYSDLADHIVPSEAELSQREVDDLPFHGQCPKCKGMYDQCVCDHVVDEVEGDEPSQLPRFAGVPVWANDRWENSPTLRRFVKELGGKFHDGKAMPCAPDDIVSVWFDGDILGATPAGDFEWEGFECAYRILTASPGLVRNDSPQGEGMGERVDQ